MDWRPVLGLGPDDAGSLWERALARTVLARASEEYLAAAKRGEGW
jgi:hypothetical protein